MNGLSNSQIISPTSKNLMDLASDSYTSTVDPDSTVNTDTSKRGRLTLEWLLSNQIKVVITDEIIPDKCCDCGYTICKFCELYFMLSILNRDYSWVKKTLEEKEYLIL